MNNRGDDVVVRVLHLDEGFLRIFPGVGDNENAFVQTDDSLLEVIIR